MSTINTILIKRRLPDSPLNTLPTLSGGELGYNEKTSTLYYGASGLGTVPIAGAGAFVDRTTSQTIGGDKTFSGLTTLSSVTVSSNSDLNLGGNILTNIGTPVNDSDASTKLYVDDLASSIAQNFVDRTNNQTVSGEKTFEDNTFVNANLDVQGSVEANSYTIDGTEVIDSSRNATFVDVTASGNITVTGDLTVNGSTTTLNTSVTTTSAFDITNSGTGPALEVTQTGEQAVAAFYDDANIALYIDGKTGSAGHVGVGTSTPNEKLTISGNVSSSGNILGVNGDFTGTLDVDSAATLGSTLYVTSAATFASSVSAQGGLTVNGTATFNNDTTVVDKLQVQSSDFVLNTTGTHIEIAGSSVKVVDDTQTADTTYGLNGISTAAITGDYTISTDNTNDIVISANSGANDVDLTAANVNITTGDLEVQSGDLNGSGTNSINYFIIDGGQF